MTTFGQVLGIYAIVGLLTTMGFLRVIRKMTMGASSMANSATPIDSRNAAGGQRHAPEFYSAAALLPTTADSLCGGCGWPAHQVGQLSSSGFCEACTPVPANHVDLSDMEIPVSVKVAS